MKVFSIILTALAVTSVNAGHINNCKKQKDCLIPTFTEISAKDSLRPPKLEKCRIEVCLELRFGGKCDKNARDTISHVCENPRDVYKPILGFYDAKEVNSGPLVRHGGKICRVGYPGETIQFLYKDGDGCSGQGSTLPDALMPRGTTFTCEPRQERTPSCTGNKGGKGCVWSVVLPPCKRPPTATIPCPPTSTPCPDDDSAGPGQGPGKGIPCPPTTTPCPDDDSAGPGQGPGKGIPCPPTTTPCPDDDSAGPGQGPGKEIPCPPTTTPCPDDDSEEPGQNPGKKIPCPPTTTPCPDDDSEEPGQNPKQHHYTAKMLSKNISEDSNGSTMYALGLSAGAVGVLAVVAYVYLKKPSIDEVGVDQMTQVLTP